MAAEAKPEAGVVAVRRPRSWPRRPGDRGPRGCRAARRGRRRHRRAPGGGNHRNGPAAPRSGCCPHPRRSGTGRPRRIAVRPARPARAGPGPACRERRPGLAGQRAISVAVKRPDRVGRFGVVVDVDMPDHRDGPSGAEAEADAETATARPRPSRAPAHRTCRVSRNTLPAVLRCWPGRPSARGDVTRTSSAALSFRRAGTGRRRTAATMFAHHVFVADGGKVSLNPAQRRTVSQLALQSRIGGPDHARPGFGQAPGDHQGRGSARPRRSKEALYVAMLNRAARRIRGELQAQAGQHGSAAGGAGACAQPVPGWRATPTRVTRDTVRRRGHPARRCRPHRACPEGCPQPRRWAGGPRARR